MSWTTCQTLSAAYMDSLVHMEWSLFHLVYGEFGWKSEEEFLLILVAISFFQAPVAEMCG